MIIARASVAKDQKKIQEFKSDGLKVIRENNKYIYFEYRK